MNTPIPPESSFERELNKLAQWLSKEGGGYTGDQVMEILNITRVRLQQLLVTKDEQNKLVHTKFYRTVIISRASIIARLSRGAHFRVWDSIRGPRKKKTTKA